VTLWPKELLEELCTHTSVGAYENGRFFNAGNKPLANIGDDVAKTALWQSLRRVKLPHAEWQMVMQQLQSNAAMCKRAEEFGLDKYVHLGSGIQVTGVSKCHADILEALIGATFLTESWDTVLELCRVLQLVYPKRGADSDEESF